MHHSLDHRELNRDLAVFATDALAGAGLPLWLPAGAIIREELQALAKEIARGDGCQSVFTPVLGKRGLFEQSGHLAKFGADMFPPMAVGGEELVLRPANCPHHALVYASRRHSSRVLPIRFNELGAMFRAERSGVLQNTCVSSRLIATVQVDFVLPQRFDLTFDAADGSRPRVVMVHRGTVGSMERVVAALLQRYQGRLPVWLAPVQVAVLPVSPDQDAPARALADDLLAAGLRPRLDVDGSLGARVRASRERREPVIAVIGVKEAAAGTVRARDIAHGLEREVTRDAFVSAVRAAHAGRCAAVWPAEHGHVPS